MITPLFGNIRNVLIEKLKRAEFDVYIAVAWITDKKYEEIILDLLNQGVSVTIIAVKDETNLSGDVDWENLVKNRANLYWDNHHHKFCVIDRKIVLTGSFNWTYMASSRMNRENLLVIEDDFDVINQFSSEFKKLKNAASIHEIEPKRIYQEVIIEHEVEKTVIEHTGSFSKYNAFKTSNNRKILCGKCSSEIKKMEDDELAPPRVRKKAYWACKNCGSYFSSQLVYL